MTIATYREARRIVDADPDVPPETFWPSVGVELDVAYAVGRDAVEAYPALSLAEAMSILEVGATLARPDVVKLDD